MTDHLFSQAKPKRWPPWWCISSVAAIFVFIEVALYRKYPNAWFHVPLWIACIVFLTVQHFNPDTFWRRRVQYCLGAAFACGVPPGVILVVGPEDSPWVRFVVNGSPLLAVGFIAAAVAFAFVDKNLDKPRTENDSGSSQEPPGSRIPTAVCPEIPARTAAIIERETPINALGGIFNDPNAIRVLVGCSGCGKSTLAAEFVRLIASKTHRWVDCRQHYKAPPGIEDAEIVVFDNVTPNHPLVSAEWLPKIPHVKRIVVSQYEEVAAQICSQLGCSNDSNCIVRLDRFNTDEVKRFATTCLPSDAGHHAEEIYRLCERDPLSLQLIRGLVITQGIESTMSALRLADDETRFGELIELFLYKNPSLDDARQIIGILSSVALVGMGADSLGQVAEMSPERVDRSLDFLRHHGLVQSICDSLGDCEGIVSAHARIRRRHSWEADEPNEKRWRDRYYMLLQEHLKSSERLDMMTCMDAWTVSWLRVFDQGLLSESQQSIDQLFDEHERLLTRLLENVSRVAFIPGLNGVT